MDSASTFKPPQPAGDTSSTVHSRNVRICHWINVIACGYLLVSGVHILLDFPELYWGHTGYRGFPAAFKLADWGLSWEAAGALGDRRWGRNYHFTFAWVFLINGLVYVGWNLYSTHFRDRMLPARDELTVGHVRTELRDHFRWRSGRPASHSSYGTLQKTSYLVADLRVRAVHDPDRYRTIARFYGRDACVAGPVRRPSVGADASHHRHRGAWCSSWPSMCWR